MGIKFRVRRVTKKGELLVIDFKMSGLFLYFQMKYIFSPSFFDTY